MPPRQTCTYIYLPTCLYTCLYTCPYAGLYTYLHTSYPWTCAYTSTYAYVYAQAWPHVHMHTSMHSQHCSGDRHCFGTNPRLRRHDQQEVAQMANRCLQICDRHVHRHGMVSKGGTNLCENVIHEMLGWTWSGYWLLRTAV